MAEIAKIGWCKYRILEGGKALEEGQIPPEISNTIGIQLSFKYAWSESYCDITELKWQPVKITEGHNIDYTQAIEENGEFGQQKATLSIKNSNNNDIEIESIKQNNDNISSLNSKKFHLNETGFEVHILTTNIQKYFTVNLNYSHKDNNIEYYVEVKCKIYKPNPYDKNVVFTEDGIKELLTNIKAWPYSDGYDSTYMRGLNLNEKTKVYNWRNTYYSKITNNDADIPNLEDSDSVIIKKVEYDMTLQETTEKYIFNFDEPILPPGRYYITTRIEDIPLYKTNSPLNFLNSNIDQQPYILHVFGSKQGGNSRQQLAITCGQNGNRVFYRQISEPTIGDRVWKPWRELTQTEFLEFAKAEEFNLNQGESVSNSNIQQYGTFLFNKNTITRPNTTSSSYKTETISSYLVPIHGFENSTTTDIVVDASILPGNTITYTLGSSTTPWAAIYGKTLGSASAPCAIYGSTAIFTSVKIGGVTIGGGGNSGDTSKFLRGDGTWSNTLEGPMIIASASGPTGTNKPTDETPTETKGADFRCTGAGYFGRNLLANKVFNAVFNDYAECRTTIDLTPGHVVIDQDDGTLACSTARLQPGAQVISDTFGHSMGETDTAKTPIAVAGRVLVYPYQSRENYHAGMAVCSAPDGTVDIMTREEIRDYPDCIVGIVSEIPEYETWGSDNVKVNGRIWIRVK